MNPVSKEEEEDVRAGRINDATRQRVHSPEFKPPSLTRKAGISL